MCSFHLLGPTALGILSDIADKRVAARQSAFGNLSSFSRCPAQPSGGKSGQTSEIAHRKSGRSYAVGGRSTDSRLKVLKS